MESSPEVEAAGFPGIPYLMSLWAEVVPLPKKTNLVLGIGVNGPKKRLSTQLPGSGYGGRLLVAATDPISSLLLDLHTAGMGVCHSFRSHGGQRNKKKQ